MSAVFAPAVDDLETVLPDLQIHLRASGWRPARCAKHDRSVGLLFRFLVDDGEIPPSFNEADEPADGARAAGDTRPLVDTGHPRCRGGEEPPMPCLLGRPPFVLAGQPRL